MTEYPDYLRTAKVLLDQQKEINELKGELRRLRAVEPSLEALAQFANDVGAEGIWLIRGAIDATLAYTPVDLGGQPLSGVVELTTSITLNLEIADAGILVLMRFPADGREPGVEVK